MDDSSRDRKVKGLADHAQKKSEETFRRVLATLQRMLADNKRVNYNSVSKEAKVSKSYLYSEPQLRQRIDGIRERQATDPSVKTNQRAARVNKPLSAAHISRLKSLGRKLKALTVEFDNLLVEIEEQ